MRTGKGRLRQRVGIDADKQRPVDTLLLAVETDSLGDGQNMGLVEGVIQRRATMAGGSEGHALRRLSGIGAINIVGGDQAGDVYQHPGVCRFTGVRRDIH